jgi:methylenetetrahydromethanopterin reductase (EC 1.5.99.11)
MTPTPTGADPTIGIELTPEYPVEELLEVGQRAEEAGYDIIYASCHYNNRDPFAFLARLADATDTAAIGPGVANPHDTHPAALASKVATVDEASDGRAVFGIGPGDPSTLRNIGAVDDRGLRPVLESFKSAQQLWAGERIDNDGTFAAADAGLNFEPPQGADIPVHVGGEGPHMCRMSAKHADGLLYNGSHPADLSWARDRVEEGRSDRPDHRGEFELLAYASVSIADEENTAREAARPPVAYITAGAAPPVLDRHDIDRDRASQIGDQISSGEFSAAFETVTPAMIDAFCMAGTRETVSDRMAATLEYADGIVAGSPLGPDLEEAVDLAAQAADDAL